MPNATSTPAPLNNENDVVIVLICVLPITIIVITAVIIIYYYITKKCKFVKKPDLLNISPEDEKFLKSSDLKKLNQHRLKDSIKGRNTARISHGVTHSDLKFMVPSVYQLGGAASACRHHSAPSSPSLSPKLTTTRRSHDFFYDFPKGADSPTGQSYSEEEMHGLRVSMYTSESDGDSGSAQLDDEKPPNPGRICFGVEIDRDLSQIRVNVKRAIGLRSRTTKGNINSCLRISVQPDPKKTKYFTRLHHSANPEINEVFSFPLQQIQSQMRSFNQEKSNENDILKVLKVRIVLFHCDLFSRKAEVGHYTFRPFDNAELKADLADKIFNPGGIELWREMKHWDEEEGANESKGQLLISLSRDPYRKTLTLGVLKGKDIQYSTSGTGIESPFVFVKLSLVESGKVLKTKRTTAKKKNQNPVFNESFSFFVKNSLLDKISVCISCCTKNHLGGTRMVGKLLVGPVMYASGSGLEHWTDMLQSPKSGVAQWHHLF